MYNINFIVIYYKFILFFIIIARILEKKFYLSPSINRSIILLLLHSIN